jgi:hypothetical protein
MSELGTSKESYPLRHHRRKYALIDKIEVEVKERRFDVVDKTDCRGRPD